MPVTLEWKKSARVLLATYSGVLTSKDHEKMVAERQKLIDNTNAYLVLLADMRELEGLRDPEAAERHADVLSHDKVVQTLIVVDHALFWQVARSLIGPETPSCRVRFYDDFDQALIDAENIAQRTEPWSG